MNLRIDARHGQRRVHPSTRVLVWRALGALTGLAVAIPLGLIALSAWGVRT